MGDDPLKTAAVRQARYLAFEILKTGCPRATGRFDARFRGLTAQVRPEDRRGPLVAEASPEYGGLSLTLKGGRPSGRFIPLIVDALFLDFLGLHRHGHPLIDRSEFCEKKLAEFLKKYFPEIDLRQAGFRHLQRLCRDLRAEAEETRRAPTFLPEETPAGPVLDSLNPAWQGLTATAAQAAWSRAPILITGESGTGKEVIARFIHRQSPRAGGPFVAVNCAALPENLLESELFGHRKGAFTDARQDKPGLAVEAQGGTLLLDEIGEMPRRLQAKLLRFLQERAVHPVGGLRPVNVDARVLATTNRDLEAAMAEGDFRQDLYYRLNVFSLAVPALRHRLEDLPLLTERFIDRYNRENRTAVRGVGPKAWSLLASHDWPGNVRELENAIQRAVILARTGLIRPEHLPDGLSRRTGAVRMLFPEREARFEATRSALEQALARPEGPEGPRRRIGESVSLDLLVEFFVEAGERFFPPRDLADFITPPGRAARRDKLVQNILKALTAAGLVEHNGARAQAARYRLILPS